jgi:hypothetical protein
MSQNLPGFFGVWPAGQHLLFRPPHLRSRDGLHRFGYLRNIFYAPNAPSDIT